MIDLDLDTLNLRSQGRWISAYIEIPGYDPAKINIATITLNYSIWAINDTKYGFVKDPEILDRDGDGYPELMVKFDRAQLIQFIQQLGITTPANVTLVISGTVQDLPFRGEASIRVIHGEESSKQEQQEPRRAHRIPPGQLKNQREWVPPGQQKQQIPPGRQEETESQEQISEQDKTPPGQQKKSIEAESQEQIPAEQQAPEQQKAPPGQLENQEQHPGKTKSEQPPGKSRKA